MPSASDPLSHRRALSSCVLKDLDAFTFTDTTVDEGLVREPPPPAPSWTPSATLSSSVVAPARAKPTSCVLPWPQAVIRARARGRFFKLVDLRQLILEQEKAAGRSGLPSEKPLRYDIITSHC